MFSQGATLVNHEIKIINCKTRGHTKNKFATQSRFNKMKVKKHKKVKSYPSEMLE